MSAQISLEPVDAANVTVLVDNFVDALLPSGEVAQRPQVAYDMWERGRGQLIAEHGLSLLLTVDRDGHSASLAKFAERPFHARRGWIGARKPSQGRRRFGKGDRPLRDARYL